jgi:hypothetical protein
MKKENLNANVAQTEKETRNLKRQKKKYFNLVSGAK